MQQSLFGRAVPTAADVLPGFRIDVVVITDPAVIATSGSDRHPVLRRGGDGDSVDGACLELSPAELAAADEYEVDDYVRVPVTLATVTPTRIGRWPCGWGCSPSPGRCPAGSSRCTKGVAHAAPRGFDLNPR